jgi:hypothetical protein
LHDEVDGFLAGADFYIKGKKTGPQAIKHDKNTKRVEKVKV